MEYYLHRISHHMSWSYPLMEQRQLLSIGWAGFGSRPAFVSQHEDDWSTVSDTIKRELGSVRNRFTLQRFLEMEQDDRVIVPTWGKFHVYTVTDNDRLVPSQIKDALEGLTSWHGKKAVIREGCIQELNSKELRRIDLGFFRRVEPLERSIPRDGYADARLTSRLKVRQTNVNISDLQKSVENAIERHRENRPINFRRQVLDRCAASLLESISDMHTPDQFERLIALYFKCQGATAHIPPKNERDKEGDADIVATFESLKLIVFVQAKHHRGETDEWAVEQIRRYADDKNEKGIDDDFKWIPWVISTANSFSRECEEKARHSGVRLINGVEFAQMLLDVGIERLQEI